MTDKFRGTFRHLVHLNDFTEDGYKMALCGTKLYRNANVVCYEPDWSLDLSKYEAHYKQFGMIMCPKCARAIDMLEIANVI